MDKPYFDLEANLMTKLAVSPIEGETGEISPNDYAIM